ncbi:MAG: sulfur carrier protein ThiS [Campylobacterota bacterium]|nr:sulfur carrier protein ThiS [Campylobacterota bacterium]
MTVIVNGEDRIVNESSTLQMLLELLNLEGKVMAAAVNMNIVKQEQWGEHQLNEGDKVELLDFVGGG